MKRLLDILGASLALGVAFPFIMAIALLILIAMGRPIIFRQLRPGLDGEPFEMLKFRTMKDSRNDDRELLPDETRITRVGKWLRSTSLDELPELWNVVRGDMSLVGPRPLLMDYLPLYNQWEIRRHEVRPGITGWAQVNGRNTLGWQEKFELDIWYVDHQSLALDLKILVMTLSAVIKRRGISFEGEATMPRFTGSRKP